MFKNIFLIFIGGGLGSVSRYFIGQMLNTHLPYGTLLANILGSLLIGYFLGLHGKQILSNAHLLILAVGFCGGFTTFSSFIAENLKMLQYGNYLWFTGYIFSSIFLGLIFVFIGFKLAKLS